MKPESSAPDSGLIEAYSVPHLLAEAWSSKRTGALHLVIGKRSRTVLIQDGAPVAVETGLSEDRFAQRLEDAGKISGPDRARVETMASDKDCAQASVVLALKLLGAKEIYQALRDQTRNQIGEALEWRTGSFEWQPLSGDLPSSAKPFDTLALLQQELPKRWGTDRLFEGLMGESEQVGTIAPRFHLVLEKLAAAGPTAAQVLGRIDGQVSVGRLLGECAGDALAAATLWLLLRTGLLRPVEEDEASMTTGFDIEVEVAEDRTASAATSTCDSQPTSDRGAATASTASTAAPEADAQTSDTARNKDNDKAEALRNEIDSLLPVLENVTHYEALGLGEDASATQIKKAYFQAAKKYHPDALARVGLDDVKSAAAQVFGRISEAFETLSDEDKRKAYDSGDAEPAEIDTARLTQAETSFRKGEILLRMGNFAGALEYLEPAVELWPDEPAYQQALGWALFKQPQSDPDRAQIHLMTALEQNPDDASTLLRLGQIARALGNDEAAADYAARARDATP